MPDFISLLIAIALLMMTVLAVQRRCRDLPALRNRQGMLLVFVLLWALVAGFHVYFWNNTNLSYDGITHDREARAIAARIATGRFPTEPAGYVGNEGYRLMLALFYTATGASSAAVYAINACFGFFGLLFVLESICIATRTKEMPRWAVCLTFGLPSALVWLPLILKEAMVVFGIGAALKAFVLWHRGNRLSSTVGRNFVGISFLFLLRPHICLVWVMSLALGTLMQGRKLSRSITIAVISVPICLGSLYGFHALNPTMAEEIQDSGISSLDAFKAGKGNIGTTAMGTGSDGFNLLSGFNVVFFSSLTEAGSGPLWLLLGLEGTACTLIGLYYCVWRGKFVAAVKFAEFISGLFAILLMAFFLGFMYNMGLAVRQRLQAVPAILVVAVLPALVTKQDPLRKGVKDR